MSNPNQNQRLADAKLALAGTDRQKTFEGKLVELTTRRAEAILAMEGRDRQKEQLAKEQAEKQAAQAKEQANLEKIRQAEVARTAIAERERLTKETLEQRLKKAQASEAVIKQIKDTPSKVQSVRTLKSDLSQAVGVEQISLTRIALQAEEKKRQAKIDQVNGGRKSTLVFLLILLFLVAGGGVYFFTYYKNIPPTDSPIFVKTPIIESLIFAEKHKKFDLGSGSPRELKRRINEEIMGQTTPGEILDLYFTTGTVRQAFRGWQEKLELGISNNVVTAFGKDFMFGVYTASTPTPFLILKPINYERAFAALLAWEKSLALDLLPLLSGGKEVSSFLREAKFEDRIFHNVDIRILRAPTGEPALLYAFLGHDLVILAKDEATLAEVIKRFRNTGQ